jgi:DNA polymerase III subunit gamma/tau
MSYQVLARKWRPRGFTSLVGQEHVVRALKHGLEQGRLHHAYLFTGTRGVGKTTIARILAKSLNCEAGVSASPCGVCAACTEIDAGRFVDLLEVDAATNTRVDEMRQLLENAVYAPTRGRYKVYVIDEVHMLSNAAFNAMLKTLEEPPEHVKFILATTDPQKIPVTVLSRCLQFNLKQMPMAAIVDHLAHVLREEGITAEPMALRLIARSANGSMRDALSLMDQAIAHGGGSVTSAEVGAMLGTIGDDRLFSLVDALIANDPQRLLAIAREFSERSFSFDAALQGLAELFVRIQVAQMAPAAVDEADPDAVRVRSFAEILHPEYVQLAYQIALQGRQQLPLAPDSTSGFVMVLLRLHAFFPARSDRLPEKKTLGTVGQRPFDTAVSVASAPEGSTSAKTPVLAASPSPAAAARLSEPSASVTNVDWSGVLERLALSGMVRELAQHCVLRKIDGKLVQLALSPTHRHLLSRSSQERLQQALEVVLGEGIHLRIDLEQPQGETPAVQAQRQRVEIQDRAVAAIESDPFVRDVIELLDASVIESSIKPVVPYA